MLISEACTLSYYFQVVEEECERIEKTKKQEKKAIRREKLKDEEKEERREEKPSQPRKALYFVSSFHSEAGSGIHGEPLAQMGSTALGLEVKEPVGYTLPDLLSLHTIDNGVEHWRHHHIKIG